MVRIRKVPTIAVLAMISAACFTIWLPLNPHASRIKECSSIDGMNVVRRKGTERAHDAAELFPQEARPSQQQRELWSRRRMHADGGQLYYLGPTHKAMR